MRRAAQWPAPHWPAMARAAMSRSGLTVNRVIRTLPLSSRLVLRTLQSAKWRRRANSLPRDSECAPVAGDGKIGVDAVLVGEVAAHAQQPAAAHRGQGFHLQPVLVELQRAVQLAQAVGHVFKRKRAVLEVDAPLEIGMRSEVHALPSGRWSSRWRSDRGRCVSASFRLTEPLAREIELLRVFQATDCPARAGRCLRR